MTIIKTKKLERSIHNILLVISLSTGMSCKKFLEVPNPQNLVTKETQFMNDATAISALNGLYTQMISETGTLYAGALSLYPGLTGDELKSMGDEQMDAFYLNRIPTNNTMVIDNAYWIKAYSLIYHCNSIIENAEKYSAKLTTTPMLIGEAKTIRAYTYFYLINIFGEVPLVLTTEYEKNKSLPQSPQEEIYKAIESDLTSALNLLPEKYPASDKIRINKWAAAGILSKVFLFERKWQKCASLTGNIINSGMYKLETDLNAVFLSNSRETIWQLKPVQPSLNTPDGYLFIPSEGETPSVVITNSLYDAIKPEDKRKSQWIKSITVDNDTYQIPYKYKIKFSTEVTEYSIILRLPEIYLISAEANARIGNTEIALDVLNQIRQRSGLEPLSSISADELVKQILNEKRIELFCEGGNRWFDLKRTNSIDTVMGKEKQNWKSHTALWPIPQNEINLNPKLHQNYGY